MTGRYHRSRPFLIRGGEPNPEETALLDSVLSHHAITPGAIDRLAYACLDCGSVGEAATTNQRDLQVIAFDFTCCSTDSTVIFVSDHLSDPADDAADPNDEAANTSVTVLPLD